MWLLVLPLLALAWWLRLATVAPFAIGTDGGLSVGLAVGSLQQILSFNARDVHPPLYYLLLHWWLQPAGLSWVALKWPSAAAGCLAAAAVARLARSSGGTPAGIIALLAITLAPSAVIAGASVRDFSCGLAATTLAALAYWMVIRSPTTLARSALALATAAGGLLWYFHLPVFAVQLAVAALWAPAARARLPLLLGAAAWLPWLVLATPPLLSKLGQGIDSFGGQAVGGGRPAIEVLAVAGGWYPGIVPPMLAAIATLGAGVIGFAVGWRHAPRGFGAIGLSCAVAGFLMLWYVNGHWDPQAGIDRYGLAVLPFVAAGAGLLARVRTAGALVLLAWVAVTTPNLVRMPHHSPANPWGADPALALVLRHWQPGDAIALESIDRLGYFAVRGGDTRGAFAAEDNGSAFRKLGVAQRLAGAAPQLEAAHARIWYVQDKNKPGQLLQGALDTSATLVQQWQTASGEVRLYARR